MEMKNRKLAAEIAEERMSMIAPCCPKTWIADGWNSYDRRYANETRFPNELWNGISAHI